MIHINKKIRFISLFIVIILVFNFIFIPKRVEAIDPISLTLGAIYTYEVAQAIYLTALTATALGVTFATIEELKKFHDMVEGTSPGPIEQYPEWENVREQVQQSKAELAQEQWFAQWGLEVLPGGQQDPDPNNNNKRGILALLGGVGIIGGFINNFVSMFHKLDPVEGENIIGISSPFDYSIWNGNLLTLEIRRDKYSMITVYYSWNHDNFIKMPGMNFGIGAANNFVYELFEYDENIVGMRYKASNQTDWWGNILRIHIPKDIPTETPQIPEFNDINYKVAKNSPIINYDGGSAGEIKYPQPNLIPIPRYNPSTTPVKNPDGTPKPGIHLILNPDGSIQERFYGTIDDLLRDIVMNTPLDEILNPDSNPYTITPGKDYITITRPELDPTVPYPQPKPPTRPEIWPPLIPDPETWPEQYPYPEWPQPDPVTWPDPYPYPTRPDPWPPVDPVPWPDPDTWPPTVPYPYPDPDTWPPTVPYPYPQPEPNPNPSPVIPVEPGKQIDYTPWLQIIINWLSRIWNKIPILPDVEVDPDIPDLFSPDPDYIKEKVEQLEIKINTKLNLPDLTPIPDIFNGIECEPIPDGYIGDNKVFDASYVNNLAVTISNWQRFFWWIVIILIGANNAYKLIRGTDLITIYGRGGKGN